MLGSGFIGRFYADSIQGLRSKDTITSIYSRREESARKFAEDYNVPHWTTTMEEAIHHPEADTVVVSLRSEEHTSELQSLMRISYAVFCLKKKHTTIRHNHKTTRHRKMHNTHNRMSK